MLDLLLLPRSNPEFVIIPWILMSLMFGYYLKKLEYPNWYLGCLPIVNLWFKRSLGGCNIILLLLQLHGTLMLFYTGFTYITVMALVVRVINDYTFAKCMLNCTSPKLYAFVPFAK